MLFDSCVFCGVAAFWAVHRTRCDIVELRNVSYIVKGLIHYLRRMCGESDEYIGISHPTLRFGWVTQLLSLKNIRGMHILIADI